MTGEAYKAVAADPRWGRPAKSKITRSKKLLRDARKLLKEHPNGELIELTLTPHEFVRAKEENRSKSLPGNLYISANGKEAFAAYIEAGCRSVPT